MSGPMPRDQWPAEVRDYRDKLDAYHLAAAEWLGLDSTKVFRLDLTAHSEIPDMYTMARWQALEPQSPRVGVRGQAAVQHRDGLTVIHEAVYLDFDDGRALFETIGPEPKLFSDEDEAALQRAFPAHMPTPTKAGTRCICPVIPPEPGAHFGGIAPRSGCPVHDWA